MLEEKQLEQKFMRLFTIMEELRAQCPWDKKQTMESLRPLTIEETYELGDAILEKNDNGIQEELGDIMLHLLFYARIGREKDAFTLGDVLTHIAEKMILRHPHIYGSVHVNNEEDVKKNWEKIKRNQEGRQQLLGGVPKSLPALVKATRIQEKVKQVGFDWQDTASVWAKVQEETQELQEAIDNKDQQNIEEEFGDLLFTLVNYGRFLHLDPETCLEKCNRKFIRRFNNMESKIQDSGKSFDNISMDEMESAWQQAKREEKEM